MKYKGKDISGIVPVSDLFNFDLNTNVNWYYDNSLNSFVIKASEDIKKGKEVI